MSSSSSQFSQIAKPYAGALFELAKEAGSLAEVEASLDGLVAQVEESDDFRAFLATPLIDSDEKAAVMGTIVDKAKMPELAGNFVKTLAANSRLPLLLDVIGAFKLMAADERDEMSADVTSAAKLNKSQIGALAKVLKDKFGKDVALNPHVDPSLIGGLVVKVGSQMIDTSLKTKLAAMRIAMKEVG